MCELSCSSTGTARAAIEFDVIKEKPSLRIRLVRRNEAPVRPA